MSVASGEWLDLIEREYVQDFVAAGGSVIKFAVGDDDRLTHVGGALAGLAERYGLIFVAIDAATSKLHMIQDVFFAIARALDIAKRLMDYGFHAPTVSFPVPGTLMVEPTESEPKEELDRFCEAMIAIRREIQAIADGRSDATDNVLKQAPHAAADVAADDWSHPYSRTEAAYPVAGLRERKYWPTVSRIDNPYGDRNLMCACPPVAAYAGVADEAVERVKV